MKDQTPFALILAFLGFTGVAALQGQSASSPKPVPETPSAAASSGSSPCKGEEALGPLCLFFGETDASRAVERFRASESEAVVVFVPDPLDSDVGFWFDQRIETLRAAAVASGFQPDRFYLPWKPGGEDKKESSPASYRLRAGFDATDPAAVLEVVPREKEDKPPAHRALPGTMLFRGKPKPDGSDPDLLVMLLVGETPSFGADPRALEETMELADRLNCDDRVVDVVGPTFSGAFEPLRQWVQRAETRGRSTPPPGRRVRVLSTASDETTLASFHGNCGDARLCESIVSYSQTSRLVEDAAFRFLDGRVAGGRARIAVLHEGDTVYGEALGSRSNSGPAAVRWYIPYPMHVSQLWTARVKDGRGGLDRTVAFDREAAHSLDLFPERPASPVDVPPSIYRSTAANTADRVLDTLLGELALRRPDFVGVVGTNISDVIFLSHVVRERVPNATLFTIGGDMLLTHPKHRGDLDGMLVFSTDDGRLDVGSETESWLQLTSTSEESTYNAAYSAFIRPESNVRRIGLPAWQGGAPNPKCIQCSQNGWVGVVGNGRLHTVAELSSVSGVRRKIVVNGRFLPWSFVVLLTILVAGGCALGLCSLGYLDGPAWVSAARWAGSGAVGRDPLAFVALLGVWSVALSLPGAVAFEIARESAKGEFGGAGESMPFLAAAMVTALIALAFHLSISSRILGESASNRWIRVSCAFLYLCIVVYLILYVALSEWLRFPHFASRAVAIRSGVSPVVPWTLICVALAIFCLGILRRLQLLESCTPLICPSNHNVREEAGMPPTGFLGVWRHLVARVQQATGGGRNAPRVVFASVVVVSCAALLLFSRRDETFPWVFPAIVTLESPRFTLALTLGFILCMGAATYLGGSAWVLWRETRMLLRFLAWGPLAGSFSRLPDDLVRTVCLRWRSAPPLAVELRYDADRLDRLREMAWGKVKGTEMLPPSYFHQDPRAEVAKSLESVATNGEWTFAHETEIPERFANPVVDILRGIERSDDVRWRIAEAGRSAVMDRKEPEDSASRASGDSWILAADFVALQVTRFLAVVFAHLRNLLGASIAVAFLTVIAAGSYPLRPQALLLNLTSGVFVLTIGVAMTIVLQSERNEVLSRIASRSPNAIDFDGAFFSQILTYVVAPVTALLVTQFPALREPFSGLLAFLGGS